MYAKIVRDWLLVITLNLLVVNFYSNAVRSKRKKRSERIRVDRQSRLVPILMRFNMWLARQNGNCNLFVECEILVQLIFNFSMLNASPFLLSLSLFLSLVLQFFHLCIHSVVRGVVNFTDSVYRRHGYSRGIETREGEGRKLDRVSA